MSAGDSNVTNLVASGVIDGVTFKVNGSSKAIFADETLQNLVADGAITVKNGVCKIAKTVAGVVAATLANPTDVTDDFKRLLIISNQAQANTVTVTGGFGNGGSGKDVCTFAGAVGNCIELVAYGGYWYVTGGDGYTLA